MLLDLRQVADAMVDPQLFLTLLPDLLLGTGGWAGALHPPCIFSPKPDLADAVKARVLRATACFSQVHPTLCRRTRNCSGCSHIHTKTLNMLSWEVYNDLSSIRRLSML